VGRQVTVEGDVVAARTVGDTCVLEFAADDPTALRVVLLIPAITNLPRQPERLYLGKRIQASGLVRAYKGRPEMVLRSPGQIEVVDVAGPSHPVEARPAETSAPPPAVAPPAAVAPTPTAGSAAVATPPRAVSPPPPTAAVAPVAPSTPEPPTPEPPAEPPVRSLGEALVRQLPAGDCARARARWKDAAHAADGLAGTLSRCLRAGAYRCRDASAALAPALTALEWAEQQVDDACP
jgi:hypothetical protein